MAKWLLCLPAGVVLLIQTYDHAAGGKWLSCCGPRLGGIWTFDKPTKIEDYTYGRHVAWMSDWLTQLDLKVSLYFARIGAAIGLRLVTAFPERLPAWCCQMVDCLWAKCPRPMAPLEQAYQNLPVLLLLN